MRFCFYHAADIHLDRSLNGLRDDSAVDLRLSPRRAFANLVDEVIASEAAFLVLSGDIYDGAWKDSSTGLFFNRQMGRLGKVGIPVFVVYGNHDALAAMPKTVHPPENVSVCSHTTAQTFRLPALNVALHGQSFATADMRENLVTGYPPPEPEWFNIGILHTALAGWEGHAPYAPCTLEQLRAKGYDYWALGHVHSFQVLSEDPWIVFPGNSQGLHVNEPGARGVVRVTVEDGRVETVERVFVDVLRWNALAIDLTDVSELSDVWRRVAQGLSSAMQAADGRHLCVRITLTGATALHAWLHVHPGQLDTEILGQVREKIPY